MSGKKTLANIFKLKYGLHIIDPKHIIKEAILLVIINLILFNNYYLKIVNILFNF